MTKQERAEVFRESMRLCRENERLKTAIENSIRNQKTKEEAKDKSPEERKSE